MEGKNLTPEQRSQEDLNEFMSKGWSYPKTPLDIGSFDMTIDLMTEDSITIPVGVTTGGTITFSPTLENALAEI